MRHPGLALRLFALSVLAAAIGSPAPPACAQSYGPGDQVLTIGAAQFQLLTSGAPYDFGIDGYLYQADLDNASAFVAPLTLPDGAEIFQLCLYANDPDDASAVFAQMHAARLAPGGQSAGRIDVSEVLLADFDIGYGVVCTHPSYSYTFHDTADVDGDTVTEHVAHILTAGVVREGGLGGVRVAWRRQVAPAPGTATFGDVPVSDPAFAFIEALVSSGVTAGCGSGNYCPDAPLTRRQMAVFLSKALGLHWPL